MHVSTLRGSHLAAAGGALALGAALMIWSPWSASASPAGALQAAYGDPYAASAATVGLMPAVYRPQSSVYAQEPMVRGQSAPRRTSTPAASTSQRSWKKTALVIGGSTGAGAGIGGLIAGKKGALIGAAIGGGAATIYESTKRK